MYECPVVLDEESHCTGAPGFSVVPIRKEAEMI
jgi:hypothetical protein